MSTFRNVIAAIVLAALVLACATATTGPSSRPAGPGLGRDATPQEIAAWDISIPPSGAGLPAGTGTVKQGEAVYAAKCVACHAAKGAGKIRRVDVSLDGGTSWREAVLQEPIFSKSVTRFRLPWEWNGARVQLQSRAVDEKGNVQPARASWLPEYMPQQRYHNNSIQTWVIEADGGVTNVYL